MARDKVIVNQEEIIDKAWEMIDEKDLKAISVRKISKELGVSPMTLYNYVENVDFIIKGIIIKGFRIINSNIENKLEDLIANSNNKFPKKILRLIADETFDFAVNHKEIYILMFNADGTKFRDDPDLFPLYSGVLNTMKKLFDEDYVNSIYKGIYCFEIFLNGLIIEKSKNRVDMSKEKFNYYIDFSLEKFLD